jgi:hypothetical protein
VRCEGRQRARGIRGAGEGETATFVALVTRELYVFNSKFDCPKIDQSIALCCDCKTEIAVLTEEPRM